jgi:hypothetical protein
MCIIAMHVLPIRLPSHGENTQTSLGLQIEQRSIECKEAPNPCILSVPSHVTHMSNMFFVVFVNQLKHLTTHTCIHI